MTTLEHNNIPSMITISIEDADSGLGNATDNESLDIGSGFQSPYQCHQNGEDKEDADAEEVTPADLEAMKQMVKGIYYSPQLFYKHSPEYLKSHRLSTMTAVPSFYSEPSRSSTTAGTCSDDNDPAITTSAQDCIAASDDDKNKLEATRQDASRKNNKMKLQSCPLHSHKEASHVPLPLRRKNGRRSVISPAIVSNLSPPPFHADGEERIMMKCPPTPRKVSPIFYC